MKRTRGVLTILGCWLLQAACSPGGDLVSMAESSDHHDGRTEILPQMTEAFGVEVEAAGPAVITESIDVFGTVLLDPARETMVRARFPGLIRSVSVRLGDRVQAGAVLAQVESDESLTPYPLTAPSAGVIVARNANPGEQTAERTLFRIVDIGSVWGMFRIFPADRARIRTGQTVVVSGADGEVLAESVIDWIDVVVREDQSVGARVVLANPDGQFLPGMHLSGRITAARHEVDVAVRRSALQTFE
jgi:cobalt-zinc-cadmium efflux system membrane fusion protein